jgi:hypothetical protein
LQVISAIFRSKICSKTLGDVMADSDQSKIRFDDFVSAVQPDPAKPEATIMLAGFVGHGADGEVRIYPDPTLGKWYDVAEGDVVHSTPIADSKLGGSYIWVRESAQIKPGSAAAAAPAAAPQAVAAAPQAAANVPPQNQNQNWNQPTPQTHCFICPPLTQACQIQTQQLHCPTQPVVCDIPPQSLHCATHPVVCDIPPHQTLATICTQVGCLTQPVVCGILPPSFNCTQQGCGAGGQQGGPQMQPQAMAAVQPTPSAVNQCGVPPPFSQYICPTPSAVHQCGAPPFTQQICPTPSAVNQCGGAMAAALQAGAAFQPTPSAVNQCGVPQAFSQHICATPSAVHQCGQPTVATLCTQPQTACICPTPTATQPGFCHPTANIACLQTANVVCAQTGVAACVPSVACTPTPNGVFTPFGR